MEESLTCINEGKESSPVLDGSNGPQLRCVNKERIVQQRIIGDCDLQSITVFLDKAEVCRSVPIYLDSNQCLELQFSQLSPFIDKDSIRIEAKNAPITIQDVTFQTKQQEVDCSALDSQRQNMLQSEKDLTRQKESLVAKLSRLTKQRTVLETFADRLIKCPETDKCITVVENNVDVPNQTPKSAGLDVFDPKHMETLNGFFDVYEKQAEKLDEQIFSTKEEISTTETLLQTNEKKLKELEDTKERMKSRELSVFIEAKDSIRTEVFLYYVVDQCSWKPSYDIRIVTNESKMKITYYAIVQQNTKEDWSDIREINISTVQPPVGGSVPDIGVQKVGFKSGTDSKSNQLGLRHPTKLQKKERMSKALSFQEKNDKSNNIVNDKAIISKLAGRDPTPCQSDDNFPLKEVSDDITSGQRSKASTLERQETTTKDQTSLNLSLRQHKSQNKVDIPSAHYSVSRPPELISSGSDPVKIIIGYIDLLPSFEYTSVPKRAPYAYLKANATNSSDYVVLPGDANVFIDSSFIGKTDLKTVAPGEEFSCHLGADHRIQISYHPMYKYREGSMQISKTICISFKQVIEIINHHSKSIKLTLMDQLPIASEDKIKVNLQEPTIKHPEKYDKSKPIRLSKSNQVEWDMEVGSGEKKEIILKYTVEYPAGECLDLICE